MARRNENDLAWALGSLRHLYHNLYNRHVGDVREVAISLLAPAIALLEKEQLRIKELEEKPPGSLGP